MVWFNPLLGGGGHTFTGVFSPNMNVIARVDFEFAINNVAILYVCYYGSETCSRYIYKVKHNT